MASIQMKSLLALVLSITPALAIPTKTVAQPLLAARQEFGTCRDQSCWIADISGSTGSSVYTYPNLPAGADADGNCCIIQHFPASADVIYAGNPGQEAYCAAQGLNTTLDANPPGVTEIAVNNPATTPVTATTFTKKRDTCLTNIYIFVKGTFEIGPIGDFVGPQLAALLNPLEWDVRGVSYDNDLAGGYCLGLPGGVLAREAIYEAIEDCPDAKIFVGGYSQGAMAIRNAIARLSSSAVAKIEAVLNFGDPMYGATINQYTGPIHSFCFTSDAVCNGTLDIGLSHISYAADVFEAESILSSAAIAASA